MPRGVVKCAVYRSGRRSSLPCRLRIACSGFLLDLSHARTLEDAHHPKIKHNGASETCWKCYLKISDASFQLPLLQLVRSRNSASKESWKCYLKISDLSSSFSSIHRLYSFFGHITELPRRAGNVPSNFRSFLPESPHISSFQLLRSCNSASKTSWKCYLKISNSSFQLHLLPSSFQLLRSRNSTSKTSWKCYLRTSYLSSSLPSTVFTAPSAT